MKGTHLLSLHYTLTRACVRVNYLRVINSVSLGFVLIPDQNTETFHLTANHAVSQNSDICNAPTYRQYQVDQYTGNPPEVQKIVFFSLGFCEVPVQMGCRSELMPIFKLKMYVFVWGNVLFIWQHSGPQLKVMLLSLVRKGDSQYSQHYQVLHLYTSKYKTSIVTSTKCNYFYH